MPALRASCTVHGGSVGPVGWISAPPMTSMSALEAKLAEIDDHLALVHERRAKVLASINAIRGRPAEMNEI